MDTVVSVVEQIWRSATTRSELLDLTTTAVCALIALAAVAWQPAWSVTRHLVTIAHEAGHGFVALLTGRRLTGIRLHSDTSGLTVSVGKPRGLGMILTAAAGYPAPTVLGLGASALLVRGYGTAVLWLLVLILALMLVQIRNWFGLWSILVSGVVLVVVTWSMPAHVTGAVATALTMFLLLAPPRTVLELQRERRRSRSQRTDADQLGALTHTSGILWVAFFLVVTLAGAVVGGWWIVDAS